MMLSWGPPGHCCPSTPKKEINIPSSISTAARWLSSSDPDIVFISLQWSSSPPTSHTSSSLRCSAFTPSSIEGMRFVYLFNLRCVWNVDPDLRAADQSQTEPFWPLPKKPGSFTGAIHETVDWFGIPHWPGPIFLGCHAALLGSQRVCMLSNNTWALVHNQILKKKSVWTTDLAICLHFTDLSNAKWRHLVIDITDTRNLHWTTTLDQD